jgi:hypothetical protein
MKMTKSGAKGINIDAKWKGKRRYSLDYNTKGMYVHDAKTGETKFYSTRGKVVGKVVKSRSGKNW